MSGEDTFNPPNPSDWAASVTLSDDFQPAEAWDEDGTPDFIAFQTYDIVNAAMLAGFDADDDGATPIAPPSPYSNSSFSFKTGGGGGGTPPRMWPSLEGVTAGTRDVLARTLQIELDAGRIAVSDLPSNYLTQLGLRRPVLLPTMPTIDPAFLTAARNAGFTGAPTIANEATVTTTAGQQGQVLLYRGVREPIAADVLRVGTSQITPNFHFYGDGMSGPGLYFYNVQSGVAGSEYATQYAALGWARNYSGGGASYGTLIRATIADTAIVPRATFDAAWNTYRVANNVADTSAARLTFAASNNWSAIRLSETEVLVLNRNALVIQENFVFQGTLLNNIVQEPARILPPPSQAALNQIPRTGSVVAAGTLYRYILLDSAGQPVRTVNGTIVTFESAVAPTGTAAQSVGGLSARPFDPANPPPLTGTPTPTPPAGPRVMQSQMPRRPGFIRIPLPNPRPALALGARIVRRVVTIRNVGRLVIGLAFAQAVMEILNARNNIRAVLMDAGFPADVADEWIDARTVPTRDPVFTEDQLLRLMRGLIEQQDRGLEFNPLGGVDSNLLRLYMGRREVRQGIVTAYETLRARRIAAEEAARVEFEAALAQADAEFRAQVAAADAATNAALAEAYPLMMANLESYRFSELGLKAELVTTLLMNICRSMPSYPSNGATERQTNLEYWKLAFVDCIAEIGQIMYRAVLDGQFPTDAIDGIFSDILSWIDLVGVYLSQPDTSLPVTPPWQIIVPAGSVQAALENPRRRSGDYIRLRFYWSYSWWFSAAESSDSTWAAVSTTLSAEDGGLEDLGDCLIFSDEDGAEFPDAPDWGTTSTSCCQDTAIDKLLVLQISGGTNYDGIYSMGCPSGASWSIMEEINLEEEEENMVAVLGAIALECTESGWVVSIDGQPIQSQNIKDFANEGQPTSSCDPFQFQVNAVSELGGSPNLLITTIDNFLDPDGKIDPKPLPPPINN